MLCYVKGSKKGIEMFSIYKNILFRIRATLRRDEPVKDVASISKEDNQNLSNR